MEIYSLRAHMVTATSVSSNVYTCTIHYSFPSVKKLHTQKVLTTKS